MDKINLIDIKLNKFLNKNNELDNQKNNLNIEDEFEEEKNDLNKLDELNKNLSTKRYLNK